MTDEELLDRLASLSENADLAPKDQDACMVAASVIMRKNRQKQELQEALRVIAGKVGEL